jgi:crossover junction endodeoxyribonuclease RuvC
MHVIVLGIDPGVANTGYGVVAHHRGRLVALDGGVIETDADLPAEKRLARLHESLGELIGWHEPKAMALEDLFFGKNVASALSVGEARGVAMLAAARHELPCFDYTPQAVKKAVCGSGSADKGQVQRMVASLLGLPEPPAPDHAADAFAVAICHAGTIGACNAVSHFGRPRVGTTPTLASRQRLAG